MRSLTKQKMNGQQGFTLIELVVVIVILGILAVTAAPKFINLQDDARTATLQAVKASMQSAAALVHSKSLIAGNESKASATDVLVYVNAKPTQINYGYPLANYSDADATNSGNWTDLLEIEADFKITVLTDGEFAVYPKDGTLPTELPADPSVPTATEDNCFAFYTQATDTVLPNIQVVPCL